MQKSKVSRNSQLVGDLLLVDGLVGGGKALISAVISSLPRMEMWVHRAEVEQICGLHFLGEIPTGAASTLMRLWADEALDSLMLGRNLNTRFKDISSVHKSPRKLEYYRRIFSNHEEDSVTKVKKERPILNLMTHSTSHSAEPIFEAFGEKITYIRINRHPCSTYMLNHLRNWVKKWGNEVRNSMLLLNYKGEELPYSVVGREDLYLSGTSMDKAILLLDSWQNQGNKVLDDKIAQGHKIVDIPYEDFVFHPTKYISQVANFLGVEIDQKTKREMVKQGVPRRSLTDAPVSKVHEKCGWTKPVEHKTLTAHFKEGFDFAEKEASPWALNILSDLSQKYLDRYSLDKDFL